MQMVSPGQMRLRGKKKKSAFTPGINIQCVCGYPVWQEEGTHVNAQCLRCQTTSGGFLASHRDITSARRQREQCDQQQLYVYVKKKAQWMCCRNGVSPMFPHF